MYWKKSSNTTFFSRNPNWNFVIPDEDDDSHIEQWYRKHQVSSHLQMTLCSTIYWSSYCYHIVTVSWGLVPHAGRHYASQWLWFGNYQLKSVTFSVFISTLWTHKLLPSSFYSSASHMAWAWLYLNLLCQHTPWSGTLSRTYHHSIYSIFILIFQTIGKMLCSPLLKSSR
jgi:hypothetical protein